MCLIMIKDVLAKTSDKWKHIEFELCFAVLAFMLLFRFGQGTDYFNYLLLYKMLPNYGIDVAQYSRIHGEFIWLLWGNLFRIAGASYEIYLLSVSLLQLIGLHRFARIYDVRNVVTLLWVYPYLYLTYYYSGIREGVVIAVFLGFMLPLLEKAGWRNIVLYYLLVIVMMGCHGSAMVLLLLPIACRIRVHVLEVMSAIAWICGAVIGLPVIQDWILATDFGAVDYYFGIGDFGVAPTWLAIIERLVFLVVVVVCYRWLQQAGEDPYRLDIWYRCWLVSFVIYGVLCWHGYLAARFSAPIRYVEILLICGVLVKGRDVRKYAITAMVTVYTCGMLLSNLSAYCDQGLYNDTVTAWNYPYISIWNKDLRYEISNIDRDTVEDWMQIN